MQMKQVASCSLMKAGPCWGLGASCLSELGPKSLIRMNSSYAWAPDIIKTLVILLLFTIQAKFFFWFVTEHISNQLEQICLDWWPRTVSYSISQNIRDENMRRQVRRDLEQTWASFLQPVVLGLYKTVSFFFLLSSETHLLTGQLPPVDFRRRGY